LSIANTTATRWGVEQRLEFIEFQAMFEGVVNRGDICRQFGVSVPQASADLAQYQERALGNISYNTKAKRYEATVGFTPTMLKADAQTYLERLRWVAEGFTTPEASWIGTMPKFAVFAPPARNVSLAALRGVLQAIKAQASIHLEYQSMNEEKPEPQWRWLSPHALIHDGMRWHARCWCHSRTEFRDFMLSRILQTGELGEQGKDASHDYVWNESIDLILGPHPKFGPSQKKIVAQDYGMTGQRLVVSIRLAMLYYFRKHMRLDLDAEKMDPQHHNMVILNPDDVQRGIDRANYRDIQSNQGQ
jgi:hypothetical protein